MTPAQPFPWSLLPRAARPALDADLGPLLRRALGAPQPRVESLLGSPLRLGDLQVIEPGQPRAPGDQDLLLVLEEPGGGSASLWLGLPLTGHLVAQLARAELGPPRPPGAPEAGLLAGLLDAVLQDLGAGLALADVGIPRGPSALPRARPTPPSLQLRAQVVAGQAAGWVHVDLDETAARLLRETALREPVETSRAAHLKVVGTFVAASAQVTASRIADLEPGDAVVFPGRPYQPGAPLPGRLRFGPGGFAAQLRPADHTLEIQGAHAMDPGPQTHETRPTGDLLDRLPVTLSLEVGQLELSAAEVARLTPGSVIALDRPLGDPVTLKAGTRPVARGELVDVAGSLGVRITDLLL